MSRVRTLLLLERWTRDTHRRERIIRAVWWRDPWGTLLRLSRVRLEARMSQTATELGHRYQGILFEIFATAAVPVEQRALAQVKVWQLTQARVRRNPEAWRVPGLLWSACVATMPPEVFLPARLKRKLMLRAFIEEVRESPERKETDLRRSEVERLVALVLRLAYQYQGASFEDTTTDEQALEDIKLLYPLLRAALRRHDEQLADWSDGALTPEDVAAIAPPYAEFDDWLFETDEIAGGGHA